MTSRDEGHTDAVAAGGDAASRHGRRWTPTAAMLVSAGVHTALLLAMASVVWHTGILTPDHPAAGFLTFESPGDAASTGRGTDGGGVAAYQPGTGAGAGGDAGDGLRAIIEPVLDGSEASSMNADGRGPIQGMASVEISGDVDAPSDALSASISGLSSGLFSPSAGSGDEAGAGGSGMGAAAMTGAIAEAGAGKNGAATVAFAGLGASGVSSVVYVVDMSGSMVTSLPLVKRELERSIARLAPTQKFGVVICRRAGSDGAASAEAFAPMLVRSTPSARQLLHDWLSRIEPAGRSSPLAGLEAALSLKPDAVFLLARSIERSGGGVWEQGFESTMARLEQLNPAEGGAGAGVRRRTVLIQTIQFLDEDPSGILQAIGERHGGGVGYRVVKRQQDIATQRRSDVVGQEPAGE